MTQERGTRLSRRGFVKSAAFGGLALAAGPYVKAAAPTRYKTALIGCGWWGMNILREAIGSERANVVGLCDVYERPTKASADEVEGLNGDKPRLYADHRELLRKERPEIVIVATPDHWHALPTIDALEAGAHVYVEKPTSYTIPESRAMVEAAKATGRVVQVGLHRRIGPHHVSGMEFLRSGKVGNIGMVRMFVANGGGRQESPTPNSAPPKGMDWNAWCGPAPHRPYNRRMTPGGWRSFLDYSNGTLGDWGVHWIDQMLWWTDEQSPKRVFSSGGRPISGPVVLTEAEATTDAPDTQVATFEFESFTATWEHRTYAGNEAEKHRIGAYFYGTNGIFHMGWRDGWTFHPRDSKEPEIHEDPRFDNERDGHNLTPLWADFIDSIEKGRTPVADIEAAHRSSVVPMLGMISYKLGRSIEWDGRSESILNDPEAQRLLRRDYREPWLHP